MTRKFVSDHRAECEVGDGESCQLLRVLDAQLRAVSDAEATESAVPD